MEPLTPDDVFRFLGLALGLYAVFVASMALVFTLFVNGEAPPTLRLAMMTVLLLLLLRLYSASSFLWAPHIPADVITGLRFVVLAMVALVAIFLTALAVFYGRRLRDRIGRHT